MKKYLSYPEFIQRYKNKLKYADHLRFKEVIFLSSLDTECQENVQFEYINLLLKEMKRKYNEKHGIRTTFNPK